MTALRVRGIRSFHRPTLLKEAQALAAEGAVPLAGGTRLLASAGEVANVLDLCALGLEGVRLEDEDLVVGAMTPLQDLIDAPVAHAATGGLLPAACRAHAASWALRTMATLGGEAVHGDPDSELLAALLALNAVFVVAHPVEARESPAVRFLKNPRADLDGGGLLRAIVIPGAPDGAALERASVLPSLPPLVAVAVTATLSADKPSRVRIALTGLGTRPARAPEAEAHVETSSGDEDVLRATARLAATSLPFREDQWAPAGHRRRVAAALTLRALKRAIDQARRREAPELPRVRPPHTRRAPVPLPYFTSGRIDVSVNGRTLRHEVEARTSLLSLLRETGHLGPKSGCGTGHCGACTVLLDGRPIASCITPAVRAHGRSVLTIEGLGTAERPHRIQSALAEGGAVHCGFCVSGLALTARALLDAVSHPTEAELREALGGALCRCTGYARPVEAILGAAAGSEP